MEKEKRKDNQKLFFEWPVGFCSFSSFALIRVLMIIMSIIVVASMTIFLYLENARIEQFIRFNRPLVQDAVRYQCQMSDYVAEGYWNNSSYPMPYIHLIEDKELQINCDLEDDGWQCTCTERD
jgi:hypothetical protein